MTIPRWQSVPIVSGRTARRLVAAGEGSERISLDLGRTEAEVHVQGDNILLPDGYAVPRAVLADSFSDDEDCVLLRDGGCEKVYAYSDATRKYYKLFQPFEGHAPSIVINNAAMHSIVAKAPWDDAADKVATIAGRLRGECLDTCCGLGYSAQLLAGLGRGPVTTCEVDDNVLRAAAVNPWSEGLFADERITIHPGDLRAFAAACPDGRFSGVFHDPPTVYQAGELYAETLYREFARVLVPGGVLYHYVGAPGRRRGQDYAGGVMRRMAAAGFDRVRRVEGGVLGLHSRWT